MVALTSSLVFTSPSSVLLLSYSPGGHPFLTLVVAIGVLVAFGHIKVFIVIVYIIKGLHFQNQTFSGLLAKAFSITD